MCYSKHASIVSNALQIMSITMLHIMVRGEAIHWYKAILPKTVVDLTKLCEIEAYHIESSESMINFESKLL